MGSVEVSPQHFLIASEDPTIMTLFEARYSGIAKKKRIYDGLCIKTVVQVQQFMKDYYEIKYTLPEGWRGSANMCAVKSSDS